MIFVTLGSQKFQFNRLLALIDKLIDEKVINEKVYGQIGYSDYVPNNYEYKDFLTREEFIERMQEADIVITHAGTGAIITALKNKKKVIAVPRIAKYQEHVDDHQVEIAENFSKNRLILYASDDESLRHAYEQSNEIKLREFVSNNQRYISEIQNYLM